jgi:hypothetical protein
MSPELWGRYLWFSLHFIAQDYPEDPSDEDKAAYKSFFENLWKVIPCYKCSVNYKRHLEELPIDDYLSTKDALFIWTVSLHNIVNKELGKPLMALSEAKKMYTNPEFHAKLCKGVNGANNNINPGLKLSEQTSFAQHQKENNLINKYVVLSFVMGIILGGLITWLTASSLKLPKVKLFKK